MKNLKLKLLLLALRIIKRKSRCSFHNICIQPDSQGRIFYQEDGVVCSNYVESERTYCGKWRMLKELKHGENIK